MKLVTSNHILLENNIIAIYTNVELFLDHIDKYTDNEFCVLNIEEKERVQIQSLLHLDNLNNKKEKFIGLFYSVDAYDDEINVWWTTLLGEKNYKLFLKALVDDEIFIATDIIDDVLDSDPENVSIINVPDTFEYAEYEEDEYDPEEPMLELDELDAYLEQWDENHE